MVNNKKKMERRSAIMRRALAIFLCLTLVVSYVPVMGSYAYATDDTAAVTEEHTHDHDAAAAEGSTGDVTEELTEEISEEFTEALNEEITDQLEEGVVSEEETEVPDPAQVPDTMNLEEEVTAADAEAQAEEEQVFYVYDTETADAITAMYGDLQAALDFAGQQNCEMTVMLMYGETYMVGGAKTTITVPENVHLYISEEAQLLLPFKDAKGVDSTSASGNGESETRVAWAKETQYLNQTMKVEGDIFIERGGKLTVAGITGTKVQEAPQGQTSGSYSQLILVNEDSDVIVDGDMEVFGLVKGKGDVILNSGSKLEVPFYIADFGGGTNILESSKTIFPAQQYGMNNIHTSITLNYGADIAGVAKIYAALEGIGMFASTGMVVIGHGDGIIDMQPGSRVDIHYVENRIMPDVGAMKVDVYGNAVIGSIQSEIMGIPISTDNKYISIPYNWELNLYEGNYSVPDEMYVKFMPGSKFKLGKGAYLNLKAGSKILAYDGFIQSGFGGRFYPSTETLQNNGYGAAGEVVLDGGTLYIDRGATFAGLVQNTGSGRVVTEDGAILQVGEDVEYIDGVDTSNSDTRTSMKLHAKYWNGIEVVNMSSVGNHTYQAYDGAHDGLKSWTMDKYQTNYWMDEAGKHEIAGGYVSYKNAESRAGAWNIVDAELLTKDNLDGFNVEMTTENEALLGKGAVSVDGDITVTVTVEDGYTINGKAPAADNYPVLTVTGAKAGAPTYSVSEEGVHTFVYTVNQITGNVTVDVSGVADNAAPTGEVSVTVTKDNDKVTWLDKLIFTIADWLNVNVKEKITIKADDKGSGIKSVHYYVSDPASENHPADEAALKNLPAASWADATDKTDNWAEGFTFDFDEAAWIKNLTEETDASDLIVYVKIEDNSGNVTYVSSGGMRYDNKGPVVEFDGKAVAANSAEPVYYYHDDKEVIVNVTDKGLKTVTLQLGNGEVQTVGSSFNVVPQDSNIPYTVTATDTAGNISQVTFYYVKPLTVKFASYDGTSRIYSQQHYGATITVPEAKEPAAGNISREFAQWVNTDGSGETLKAGDVITVKGNATYEAEYTTAYKVTPPAETAAYSVTATEGTYFAEGATYTITLTNKDASKYCHFTVTANGTEVTGTNGVYTYTVGKQAVIFDVTPMQHDLYEVEVTAPTCTTYGKSEIRCRNTDCDYLVVNEEVPMLSHNFDTIDEEKSYDPTCTEPGLTVGTCSNAGCNGTVETVIPATGHNYTKEISLKEATCAATGLIVKQCEACEDTEEFFVKKLPHQLKDETIESTDCTAADYKVTTCENCDYENIEEIEGTAGTHTEVTVIQHKNATCETAGNTIGTECSVCKMTLTESEYIAPLNHNFGEFVETKAADCDDDGLKVSECANCDAVKEQVIDKLGHDYTVTTQKLTCTQDGFTKKVCETCEDEVIEDHVKAPGHTEQAIPAVPATCYAEGSQGGVECSVCGEIVKAPVAVEMIDHVWSTDAADITVVEPTCKDDGYIITKCADENCTAKNVVVTKSKGHDWAASYVFREAKCGQIGIRITKCNECTITIIDPIMALDHQLVKDEAVAPTCSETGLTAGEHCELCGYVTVKQDVIKALAHDIVVTEGKEATCTEAGLTDKYHCDRCGEVLKSQEEIPAKGHSFGEWKVTKAATCETAGEKVQSCACGETKSEVIEALGHSYGEGIVTEATCTVDGYTTYTCGACGDTKVEAGETAEHDWKEVETVKEATCTEDGLKVGTCAKCDGTVETVIPALGHDYKDTVTAATCTEKGYTTHECETCGHTYKDAYTAASHKPVDDKGTAATCTEPGLTDGSHCEACGEVLEAQTVIEALGHSYEKVVTAPTCTETGYTTYTCEVCEKTYKDDTTQAAGHKFSAWEETKAATCTAAGEESRTCGACDVTETRAIDALGHTSKVLPGIAATCDKAGLTAGSECSVCGEVLKAQTAVPALGHAYKAEVTAPTCTAEGYTTHSCTRCDDVYTDSKTAAIGHEWKDAGVVKAATCEAAGIAKEECVNCGETKEVEIAKLAHTPEKIAAVKATCIKEGLTEGSKCSECGTVLKAQAVVAKTDHVCDSYDGKEPTCTSRGYEPYDICRICDYTTYKEIPALGHSFKEVVTEATCTEDGYITKYCKCGHTETAPGEAAKGHTVVEDAAVAATCETFGKTAGSHCGTCGEVLVKQETVPAKGHNYGQEQYQIPTAEADGGWYKVCVDCGDKHWTKTQTFAEYVKAGVEAATVTLKAAVDQKNETVKLTWTKSEGLDVTHYEIWRSKTGKAGSFAKVGQVTELAYTDKTAKPGTKYYYKVRGIRVLDGESYKTQFSNVPTATIKKVTAAQVKETKMRATTEYAGRAIKINWTSPNIKVDGYEIWRSTAMNGTYKLIKTTNTSARTWTNTGLKLQNRYYYKVRGYKMVNGKKVYTQFSAKGYRYVLNAVNAKLANAIEDANAITAKKAAKVNGGIKVTWSKDSSIKCNRYEIWRSTSKNGTYTKIATTKNMSYTDKAKKLKSGKRYYYKVVGYRFFGKACPKTNASNVVSAVR